MTAVRSSREFDDYWNEFRDIEQSKAQDELTDEDASKTPDEGEQELAWLREAGFKGLATKYEEGNELEDHVLLQATQSLTRSQAAAVKKRVDTLNATLKKRQFNYADMRELFVEKGQQPSDQDGTQRHSKRTHVKKRSLKRGHQYSMTGEVEEAEGGALTQDHPGIETLSIQSRASPMHIITQQEEEPEEETGERLSRTVSDSEVKLNFKTDDSSDVTSDSSLNFSNDSVTEESEGMPNYVLVQDELGVTKIDDVGPEDKEKIRALAYIELTALFDIYNILFTPIKSKVKIKEQGLFGVPLHTLQHEDRGQHVGVPLIFKQIISFLEKNALEMEGILRVPGSAARIRNLRQQIEDTFPSGEFSWNDVRPNDAAALLKQFLRELPEPLLTNQCTDAFAQVQAISDKKQQLQALNLLILLLPDVNRSTLKLLLQFLHHVIDHKQQNKMSLANVAMIMAPNLFLVQSHYKHKDLKELETQRAASMSNIVKMLIRYHHILWTVPSVMLMQVRHQYEMEQQKKTKDKSIMQLFGGKKDKSEVYKKISSEAEFKEGIIRVQAPGLTKNSTAVQLDENMTAGEIVAKFKRKTSYDATPQRSSKGAVYAPPRGCANPMNVTFAMDNSYLYECGGNIGERRLDNNANMLALYKVNPNAEWIIKDIPVSRMQ